MSVRIQVLLTNGSYWSPRQPGNSSNSDNRYIECLYDNENGFIEKLNKGLKSSQMSWFPDNHLARDNVSSESTYYSVTGEELSSGQTSGLNSTPGFHPWRFRETPESRLNELFWPTQLQRHAEMFVAFCIMPEDALTFFSQRNAPPDTSGDLKRALGIDRVFIQMGFSTPGPSPPIQFNLKCAGIYQYTGLSTEQNILPYQFSDIYIMKLVDDRYYWKNLEFDPFLGSSSGYLQTAKNFFDVPESISIPRHAREIIDSWGTGKLEFGDITDSGIYQNKDFGFTIYPHSVPPSGLKRGLASDWAAWTQGYIANIYPYFSSTSTSQSKTERTNKQGRLSFTPAFLGKDSIYPKDYDIWRKLYNSGELAQLKVENLNYRSVYSNSPWHANSDSGNALISTADGNYLNRSTWPDVSVAHRAAKRSGFFGRIRIDLRENDILYGQRFINNQKSGVSSNEEGGDSPYHIGTTNQNSKAYSEKYLLGQNLKAGEIGTPILTVNTALFSNEVIDTLAFNEDWQWEGEAPANNTRYIPSDINNGNPYAAPGNRYLVDASHRIISQYEYLANLDTGPLAKEFIDWDSNHTKDGDKNFFDAHTYYHSRGIKSLLAEDDWQSPQIRGSWFFCYESFVFSPRMPDFKGVAVPRRFESTVSCMATSFRKDGIPLEMPVTWSAPTEIVNTDSEGNQKTIPVTLEKLDNGQQIYAEGIVVEMTGFDNPTYYMRLTSIKPGSALGASTGSSVPGSLNFASLPIVRLHKPADWPTELVPGSSLTCMRMPEQSNLWWSPQWVPLTSAEGSSTTTKQLVRFTLDVALATTDASQPATITDQYGPGSDNSDTAITAHNLLTSTAGTFVFEGDVGDAGLAMRDTGQDYRIIQIECPDTASPDPDPGGGDGGDGGDPGGETP